MLKLLTLLLRPHAGCGDRGSTANTLPLDGPAQEPEFVAWLSSQGLPEQPLQLRDCGGEGRGLVASRRLPRGTPLLNVPESLLLTADVACRDSPFCASIHAAGLPEWTLLACFLAELRYAWQTSGAAPLPPPSSSTSAAVPARWAPYMAILPGRPGTVLEWPAREVAQLLAGSPLLDKANAIVGAAKQSWQEVAPHVTRAQREGRLPKAAVTEASLNWAFGILLSRLVRLPGKADSQALIPWADLLNHSLTATAHIDWDGASRCAVVRPEGDLQPGQQLYISYGQKSSGELLLSYGFCPASPGANPHESYALSVGVSPDDPLAEVKKAALARVGQPPRADFPLKIDGYPEQLLPYLAVVAAAPAVAAETNDLVDYLFTRGEFPELDGVDTWALALRALDRACAEGLEKYSSAQAEQDQKLAAAVGERLGSSGGGAAAAGPVWGGSSSQQQQATVGTDEAASSKVREALCAAIRVRERQILSRVRFIAAQQLAEDARRWASATTKAARR